MQLKLNKSGTFFDVIIKHIITEVALLIVIAILYVGYGFLDNMFITRERERSKSMETIKASIADYTAKIKEYQELLAEIRATGEDKRVVSGFYLSRIEKIFNSLSESFDIKDIQVSLDVIDPVQAAQSLKLVSLPEGVNLMAYSFRISGRAEVETDVYNMLSFLEVELPGVIVTKNISIEAVGFQENGDLEQMLKIKALNMKVSGEWFFLTND